MRMSYRTARIPLPSKAEEAGRSQARNGLCAHFSVSDDDYGQEVI